MVEAGLKATPKFFFFFRIGTCEIRNLLKKIRRRGAVIRDVFDEAKMGAKDKLCRLLLWLSDG